MLTATKNGVTVASTTASQEQLNDAVGLTAEEVETPEVEVEETAGGEGEEHSSETASASETDTADEEEHGEEEPDKPSAEARRGGWQRRIDKLTKTNRTLEETLREERLARQRLEAMLAGKPAKTSPEAEAGADGAAQEDPEPDESGLNPKTGKPWKDWKEFSRAHAAWSYRQEQAQAQQRSAAESEQQSLEQNFRSHQERLKAAETKYQDWHEVAEKVANVELPQAVGLAIIELENGPDVLYKLAKDPALVKEIQGMSEFRAIARIGAISASLQPAAVKPSSSTAKPRSQAPEPITPVNTAAAKSTVDPSKMSLTDYVKGRNEGRIK